MQANDTVRIGFIGAGNHSTQALYPNFALIDGCRLVAACDLQRERVQRVADAYGLTPFTDIATMLDSVELDAVCVCGMPDLHHEGALAALARKLPVFIEKPPAPTLAQSAELVRAAEAAGSFGMVGFMKRFAPANVVTKEYVDSPAFGGLATILLIHGAGPYDDMRRMLMFNGIHPIDVGRFLAGDVASVFAHAHVSPTGVQALCAAFRFASGAVGQLNMNSGATWSDCYEQTYVAGRACQISIIGSREVEVMTPNGRFARGEGMETYGWSNRYYVSGNMSGWSAGGHYTRGYYGELQHFVRAVRGEVQPKATLGDGLEAMRIIDAILMSANEGREVRLEDIAM